MLRFFNQFFEPKINDDLWPAMDEIISEHEKVYINICKIFFEEKKTAIAIQPKGLLKYRLLGASFLSAAVKTKFYSGSSISSPSFSEIEKKTVSMAIKGFSPESPKPYDLSYADTSFIVEALFPIAQNLVIEDFKNPMTNFKPLYDLHHEALSNSISDRAFLDRMQFTIGCSVTSPLKCVSGIFA
jgi:hypothetical protein